MDGTVVADVGVGEGGEETGEAAKEDEDEREGFVEGVAMAAVGEDWAEELEEEDGAGREDSDQISGAGESFLLTRGGHFDGA